MLSLYLQSQSWDQWRSYGLGCCQGHFLELALSICFASAAECKALAEAATLEDMAHASWPNWLFCFLQKINAHAHTYYLSYWTIQAFLVHVPFCPYLVAGKASFVQTSRASRASIGPVWFTVSRAQYTLNVIEPYWTRVLYRRASPWGSACQGQKLFLFLWIWNAEPHARHEAAGSRSGVGLRVIDADKLALTCSSQTDSTFLSDLQLSCFCLGIFDLAWRGHKRADVHKTYDQWPGKGPVSSEKVSALEKVRQNAQGIAGKTWMESHS